MFLIAAITIFLGARVMPRVLITCPETLRTVYTGLSFDWNSFETVELEEQSIPCPHCGRLHSWRKADALLVADGGEG
jgi:hypothetical protein